jgi:hypothetical protein
VNANAKRKEPREWTVLGKPMPRVDLPAMATAQLEYVHNVRVPGMVHGAVVRPPEVGAALEGVDEASVRNLPGFIKVVVRKNFVGVVAAKPWQAIRAAAALKATWSAGSGLPPQAEFYDYLRTQPSRDTLVVDSQTWTPRLRARRRSSRRPIAIRIRCTDRWAARARCRRAGPIGSRCGRPRNRPIRPAAAWRRSSASPRSACASCSPGVQGATGSTAPTPCRTTRR